MNIRNTLSFLPLGGVEDINRNCYVVEYGRDIVVVDLGISFPDENLYGVNYLIPDVDYLKKRRERIRGIVLTHGHLDHVGALAYVIQDLGFPPVYGREFTMLFLEEKLKEFGLDQKVKRVIVEPKTDVQLGSLQVRFIPVTHAIPQSSSVQIKSPAGNIVYTGDYRFDDAPVREPMPDYAELERVGREGVLLAAMDSTNVYEEGKSRSEQDVSKILEKIIRGARGRVIASTFSSSGSRLFSLIEIAKRANRKIVVSGRSMRDMIVLLKQIGYVEMADSLVVSEKNIKGIPDEKLLVLTTGSQGEEMAALSRMARGEHQDIRIKDSDTVILSSSVIPGNQVPVQHMIDDLLKLGAHVVHQSFMDVHTSGHGYQDDMKKMYGLLQPKFVMPVHGWRSFVHEAIYLLGTWGMKRNNILHPETGLPFEYSQASGTWQKGAKVACQDVYIDGTTIGETDDALVQERTVLAHNGVVVVGICGRDVSIDVCGVINVSMHRDFIEKLRNEIGKMASSQGKSKDEQRSQIRRLVSRAVETKFGKEPAVVVVL